MIGILIIWLIAGILLVVFSGLMYYNNTFGLLGLTVILLQGIVVLLLSTSHLISRQDKRNVPGKSNTDALKSTFIVLIVISVLVFGFGALGYLLGELGIYEFNEQMTSTLFAFLIIGVLTSIGSILSWIYVERSVPDAISSAISKQESIIKKIKTESEEIGTEITSIKKDISDLTEGAVEIGEKNREELR